MSLGASTGASCIPRRRQLAADTSERGDRTDSGGATDQRPSQLLAQHCTWQGQYELFRPRGHWQQGSRAASRARVWVARNGAPPRPPLPLSRSAFPGPIRGAKGFASSNVPFKRDGFRVSAGSNFQAPVLADVRAGWAGGPRKYAHSLNAGHTWSVDQGYDASMGRSSSVQTCLQQKFSRCGSAHRVCMRVTTGENLNVPCRTS